MWIRARERVATLVGRGITLNDAVLCVTMNMDAARAALQHRFRGVDVADDIAEATDVV